MSDFWNIRLIIQRDSGSDCDFFDEINSHSAINEEKELARCPEDPVYQREKPKTQVNKSNPQQEQFLGY